eukprot:12893097-Prorocentrum_lima.AAC.1
MATVTTTTTTTTTTMAGLLVQCFADLVSKSLPTPKQSSMTLVWEKPPKASRRAGGGYSKLAELAYLWSGPAAL